MKNFAVQWSIYKEQAWQKCWNCWRSTKSWTQSVFWDEMVRLAPSFLTLASLKQTLFIFTPLPGVNFPGAICSLHEDHILPFASMIPRTDVII
jgi:hypothetical protein